MKRNWWKPILCLLALVSLSGCVTLGPKVQTEIVFVRHKGVAARALENKKVRVAVEKDGKVYVDVIDIGGFYLISPDLKDEAPAEPHAP